MHLPKLHTWLAVLGGLTLGALVAPAQDSSALIEALAKNGVITKDQAQQILKDISKAPLSSTEVSTAKGKYLKSLTLYGFLQEQYYNGSTDIDGAVNPNFYTNRFFLRRAYIGFKSQLTENFSSSIFYDFAGAFFEQAFIEWKKNDLFTLDVGQRKVPFAYDETTSSRELKAIERSPITNYFTGSNNNRRLGGGSLRHGLFAFGTQGDWSYTVAVTNPDRAEFAAGGGTPTAGDQRTTAKANGFAYWGRLGYDKKLKFGKLKLGVETGYLPEQGGNTTAKTTGSLSVYGAYADLQAGNLNVQGAYLWAQDRHAGLNGSDANPSGYWLQPSYKVGNWEGVIRYSSVDTDGRGIDIADAVRAAPGSGAMDKLTEWYFGGTYFFLGNDVKLQAGYIHAEAKNTPLGATAKATSDGLRTQLQLNF
jgi:hypothetical protein